MIIDTAIKDRRNKPIMHDSIRRAISSVLYSRMHRFVFEDSAAHKLGHMARDWQQVVYANAEIALPPFPVTYVEFPNIIATDDNSVTSIERIGYLFLDKHFFVCCGNEKEAAFSPFGFSHYTAERLHPRDESSQYILSSEAYRQLSRYIGAGLMPQAEGELLTEVRQMMDLWNLTLVTPGLPNLTDSDAFSKIAHEFAGCLRWGLAAMLLLNERRRTKLTQVAASRKLISGKLYPVAQHNVVIIDLDANLEYYTHVFSAQSHATPRLHDVAEHWVHYDVASQCKHAWVPYHSEEAEARDMERHGYVLPRYICTLCGGRRTRKQTYERGDISKGRVEKHYKVIASKEKDDGRLDDDHGSVVKSDALWQPGNNNEED